MQYKNLFKVIFTVLEMSKSSGFEKFGKICTGVIISSCIGAGLLALIGFSADFWGSRGVRDIYTFQYSGRPAALQKDNRIWAIDRHYIVLNEKDTVYKGTVLSDDGKRISVDRRHYSIGEGE